LIAEPKGGGRRIFSPKSNSGRKENPTGRGKGVVCLGKEEDCEGHAIELIEPGEKKGKALATVIAAYFGEERLRGRVRSRSGGVRYRRREPKNYQARAKPRWG